MNLRTISSIYTIEESCPDDLFICSVSFKSEKRCLNASSMLSKSYYKTRESLLIRYTGEFEEKYQNELCKNILPFFTKKEKIEVMDLDRNDIISFWYNIKEWFKGKVTPNLITIDVSTFTKSFLLILLKFLRQKFPQAKVRILYTVARYPTIPKNVHLSWGIKDVIILPYFGSFKNAKNGNIFLFLFLGYEAERAYSIWRSIEPTYTVAIVGEPPTYPGAEVPARALNKFILKHPQTLVKAVSALNPMESKEIISEWYKKRDYKDFLFFISPLGTKMQVVGIYLFFEKHEPLTRAKIIYALPAQINENRYSLGYEEGKVWEYYLPEKYKH